MAAKRLVNDHGEGDEARHIVWVSGHVAGGISGAATERMFLEFDEALCVAASSHLGFTGDAASVLDFMARKKGAIGMMLAAELIERYPWEADEIEGPWPASLCELMGKLDSLLPRRGSNP